MPTAAADPAPTRHTVNAIGHFDVAGPEIAPLGAFYQAVMGWTVQPRGPGYAQLQTPAGSVGGALVESEQAGITLGVVVADLAAALQRAEQHQGRVVMPITDNGWVRKAQVADPAGNVLTLIQAAGGAGA